MRLQKNGRYTLAKAAYRMVQHNTKSAFEIWKMRAKKLTKTQKAISKLLYRVSCNYKCIVMQTWTLWISRANTAKVKRLQNEQLNYIKQKEVAVQNLVQEAKVQMEKKDNMYIENGVYISKAEKMVSGVKAHNTKYFTVSKLRGIFQEWHRISTSPKIAICKLEKTLNKLILKKAIWEFNFIAKNKVEIYRKRASLKSLLVKIKTQELRKSISKWQSFMLEKHATIHAYTATEQDQSEKTFTKSLLKSTEICTNNIQKQLNFYTKRKIFQGWFDVLAKDTYTKRKLRILLEKKIVSLQKQTLQQWNQNAERMRLIQRSMDNFERRRDIRTKTKVFYDGFVQL